MLQIHHFILHNAISLLKGVCKKCFCCSMITVPSVTKSTAQALSYWLLSASLIKESNGLSSIMNSIMPVFKTA